MKLSELNNKKDFYQDANNLWVENLKENKSEKYNMIFPSFKYQPFPLKDRFANLSIKDNNMPNTCTIRFYISNDGINRSGGFIRKDPHIIKVEYCYIDYEGEKYENNSYIENETTKNCQSELRYVENDFYNTFAIRRTKFSISGVIDDEIDNSIISVPAEYKHGINDNTIKNKRLVKLGTIINEIQQLTNDETGFSINVSESYNCLRNCIINEGMENNAFFIKLLAKKLPKIRKQRRTIRKSVVNKNGKDHAKLNTKEKRAETYKEKVSKRSENTITVVEYISSREKVTAQCNKCEHVWKIRSDHLLARSFCPACK